MKEFVVVFAFIILASGTILTLFYHSRAHEFEFRHARPEPPIIAAITLFLGFFSLHSIWRSVTYNDKGKRNVVLLMGVIMLLTAFFMLEALLQIGGR